MFMCDYFLLAFRSFFFIVHIYRLIVLVRIVIPFAYRTTQTISDQYNLKHGLCSNNTTWAWVLRNPGRDQTGPASRKWKCIYLCPHRRPLFLSAAVFPFPKLYVQTSYLDSSTVLMKGGLRVVCKCFEVFKK